MLVVTASEMQEMDRLTIESFGLSGLVLMENAGRAAVDVLFKRFPDIQRIKIGIMAGRGNNGGDGFVMARYLAEKGVSVTVYLLAKTEDVKGDAATNLKLLHPLGIKLLEIPDESAFDAHKEDLLEHDIWVDAMLGTGLKSDVRGIFRDVIEFLNNLQRPILAVDIPSGLNPDSGKPCGICIKADTTVTFGFPKIGQVIYPGIEFAGNLKVVDIGIPSDVVHKVEPKQSIITKEMIASYFKPRLPETHKGGTGHLLVVGGSPGKTGAVSMTAKAAMRIGAGLVTLALPESLNHIMEAQLVEVMTEPLPETSSHILGVSAFNKIIKLLAGKKGLALGPGMGTNRSTRALVRRLIQAATVPMIIDADGLNCLVENIDILKRLKAPAVLTPHPGEMARLLGIPISSVQENRISVARDFATEHQVYLVLKGARTIIANPQGMVFVNPTGNPGMASGGMGDVLTGMIAGLIVQGFSMDSAVQSAVYLHGAAADHLAQEMGEVGILATDIIERIPKVLHTETSISSSDRDPFIRTI
nr:NAD(P)H-hydrate dehydratase [Desulfobacterales bacterium]